MRFIYYESIFGGCALRLPAFLAVALLGNLGRDFWTGVNGLCTDVFWQVGVGLRKV
jgi:hypothetical protein